MHRLITLGCSLTHHAGWAQYLQECMKIPLHNLSRSAGSNQLQQRRLQEFIFKSNIIEDDIVIWQLTSTYRYYKRELLNEKNKEELEYYKNNPNEFPTVVLTNKNIFDKLSRVDYLCNSFDDRNKVDEAQILEDLLFYLIAVRKHTPNFFVFFGWQNAIPTNYQEEFKQFLKKNQIEFIDIPLVEWCYQQNLKFDLGEHPTIGSSSHYARDVIIPEIERKLNIKIDCVPIWAE